ncbi:lipopolysaccharide biosynthesis protein [Photobacterium aquimaris]|nr:lipopolysaccharide biosynthesis protein [Photobacterium aquimaris]OBU24871.1 hypothetical protein AYY21_10225 [Photobacterium aquimaris]
MQFNNVLRNIVRCICIFCFFYYDDISLISVGYATLVGSLCSVLFAYFYKIKLISYMKFDIRYFRLDKVQDILKMGGWLLINQLGFVLFMKVDLLIVNKYLGPEQSGLYSIAIQFNDVLRIFASIISGVLGPAILILYSQNKIDDMIKLTSGFVKFLSLSISIPIVIICVWSKEILNFWMGSSYISLSSLVWILTLPLVINIGVQPLFAIQVAMNKIKIPAILNIVFGFFGIVSSVLLITKTDLGFYSVAISSVIMLTIKNAIFTPLYSSYILNVDKRQFIYVHINTLICTFISIVILLQIKNEYVITDLYDLILIVLLSAIVLLLFSLVFYTKNERDKFIKFIKEKA